MKIFVVTVIVMIGMVRAQGKEQLLALAKGFDTDGDGYISKAEFGATAGGADVPDAAWKVALALGDKNKDKKMSVEEFVGYTQSAGGAGGAGGPNGDSPPAAAFGAFDTNSDGFISKEEMAALTGGAVDEASWKVALQQGDKNGDKKLSVEEFRCAGAQEGQKPEGCGAASITATISLLLFVSLAALLF